MLVAEILEALEVAGLRQDHAAVHHRRLEDHAGDLPRVLLEGATRFRQIVEGHHANQVGEGVRDAERLRDRDRMLARTDLGAIRGHAEHDRVVMAVVGPLDLDQHVAACVRPHQADSLERRLRAGVRESPERELEAVGEVLAHHGQVLRRLREMRAAAGRSLDRLDDLRMGVADDHRAVSEVEVDVLVAIDVVEPVAVAPFDVDRVGRRVLPAGGHSPGHEPIHDRSVSDRRAVLRLERRLLLRDQLIDPLEIELDRVSGCHTGSRLLARRPPEDRSRGLNGRSGSGQMVPYPD